MKKETYAMYGDILREELLLAMGCTEPVAVAYAGALPEAFWTSRKASANVSYMSAATLSKT